ncbi:cytochrome c oxidase family protein [Colletotrichum truncatum]|uniref:Cytochrome c oxidase family protein n=1 Tax=Colletotrichum truncatum TaxID=5467 RepID=A0ACC3YEJ0_COLTU
MAGTTAVKPITGMLRRNLVLDLGIALGLGFAMANVYWYALAELYHCLNLLGNSQTERTIGTASTCRARTPVTATTPSLSSRRPRPVARRNKQRQLDTYGREDEGTLLDARREREGICGHRQDTGFISWSTDLDCTIHTSKSSREYFLFRGMSCTGSNVTKFRCIAH